MTGRASSPSRRATEATVAVAALEVVAEAEAARVVSVGAEPLGSDPRRPKLFLYLIHHYCILLLHKIDLEANNKEFLIIVSLNFSLY